MPQFPISRILSKSLLPNTYFKIYKKKTNHLRVLLFLDFLCLGSMAEYKTLGSLDDFWNTMELFKI
jgi:hypothetical protein